jgi:cytochrome d ubiquinol oxidase subunit I
VVTEAGRQPWAINGVLRTSDAVTPAGGIHAMFFLFTVLYLLLAGTVVFLLRRLGRSEAGGLHGPQEVQDVQPAPEPSPSFA